MGHFSQGTGLTIKLLAMANIHGMMEENMKGNGAITIWTGTAYADIKMAECTKECIRIIRNTAMGCIHGLMVKSMMETGLMAYNMVMGNWYLLTER